ncbi:EutN/CcmL family microcompartment protein [Peptoniphilus sp. AGMB00490]|uniref:EutN/CcmL family microcompartment protein n=2 Tax=Peptoniphilus TaxID=162289 RepID=A0ACD6AZQ3_9FIRM|nr:MULTISPECIES: EutN/CcmL family microcompartment protein [Peptoniphilus]NMW85320.1 EutN/CcmL family microcompartment protein [Peptoniphilus faecalis]OLR65263.1 ethanolamine utilization protein EutN [Peptoniphilus porci]
MVIAKLVGKVWSTRKYDSLNGLKFMLVELTEGVDKGKRIVAVDTIGAGDGETVLVTLGSSARVGLSEGSSTIPIDALIIGIVDEDCKL